jgi:hypothetical protein
VKRIGLALLAAGGLVTAGGAPVARAAAITGLEARVEDGAVRVSFELRDAFSEELGERLHSGIPVTFRHRVELVLRRAFVLAPNRLLDRTVVETRIEYDALTRQYRLHRSARSRARRGETEPYPELVAERSTESLEDAVAWLTALRDVPVMLRAGVRDRGRLKVRVTSHLGKHLVLWVFPADDTVSAELRLGF